MVGSPVHGPVARLETARVRAPPTERGVWRENIRRSKEGGSARWPSIVHSHVGMQAMADVKVSLPRSAPNACETHAAFVLDLRSACVWYYVCLVCSRFWQESALHVALGSFIRDRDRRFYRNDRGGIRFDRYRAPSVAQPRAAGAPARAPRPATRPARESLR